MIENQMKSRLLGIDYLRTAACLSVVLLHAIKFEVGFGLNGEGLDTLSYVLLVVSGLLAFGTPTFIVISEILLSYSYPKGVPSGFYMKRVKFILFPFICMALFYAIVSQYGTPSAILPKFIYNLMGGYHGWFILVIFQFYLLHQFFTNYIFKFSPVVVLLTSFIINAIYLGFFNFYVPSTSNQVIMYIWDRGYWVLFLGWIFYFSVAYYLGKYYKSVLDVLTNKRMWVYTTVPVSVGVVLVFNNIIPDASFGSKRFDLVFLTFSIIATVLILTKNSNVLPLFVGLISRYSFGIYLMHWFFMTCQTKIFVDLGLDFGYFNILVYFTTALLGSIFSVYVVNKFKLGKYVVGNVRSEKKQIESKSRKEAIT